MPAAEAQRLVAALLRPGGIRTVFQPVVRVADGAVIGYEALSRAAAAPGMAPDQWLRLAEECGLRAEVELACLETAIEAGEPPGSALLFVNISPDVALHPTFPALCRRLPRHVIEITEHAAVADYAPLVERLRVLRSQGSLVAVDDVGSGYASMAHVLRLSPSFIKIDRDLVNGLHRDPRRRALVEALQAFASATSALSIAEGVETEAELVELQALGVDLAQGYLLGRPQDPWSAITPQAQGILAPRTPAPQTTCPPELTAALDAAVGPVEACEVISDYLSHHSALLPSVYLERGGVLRCQSRRGQWLVMDGLRPRTGLTGAAYADETEILCPDVRVDARYRLAIPGVLSEMAVPLRVHSRTVGVLNVDALAPLLPADVEEIRRCARLLEQRLTALDQAGARDSTLRELSRLAPTLAEAGTARDLCDATLQALSELTDFEGGCIWSFDGPDPEVIGAVGTAGETLRLLDDVHVRELRDLVSQLSSCYSGGSDLSLAVPPTHVLREHGARGVVVVPIRDGWRLTDVLALTSTTSAFVSADIIDAVESLCLQAGSRLAALRRVAQLEELAHRDPLTGVGNRGLWTVVAAEELDPGEQGAPLWLATADVDRFKQVNDLRGHLAGDQVLRALAELFTTMTGWSVFRLGGDEFTMFGPATGEHWPSALAAVAAQAHDLLGPLGASVSIGAVRTTRGGLTAAHDVADQALYRRKRQGGDGLTVHTDVPGPGGEPVGEPVSAPVCG